VAGKYPHPNMPFNMQDMEFKQITPAPLLGQHNEEICETMLNISTQEINQMKDEGILESILPEKQE
jgi:crotonobetainyl-CoA:carnitine CoA-transferase CaiB-like acyl-CoA transferase